MHPEVRAAEPGPCPICHMKLEAVARGPARSAEAAGLVDTTAVENVRKHKIIEFSRKRALLFDTRDLRAPASVDPDGAVTALYYQDQIAALADGQEGTFSPAAAPAVHVTVRRASDAPARWDASTARVRFRPEARRPRLVAGQTGWLEVPRKPREVLTVPASAVLQSAEGPYVLTPTGPYSLAKRRIEIGETFLKQGIVVVLSGLGVHEPVVSRAAFFV